jgi:hypothetical protein
VKLSPAFKWFLVFLLPLTIACKFTFRKDDIPARLKEGIINFLTDQRFAFADTKQEFNGMAIIRASAEPCRLLIMRASPDGWTDDVIHNQAAPNDRVYIVFRGELYADKVTWGILISYLQSELLYRLGLVPHVRAVIAVVAAPACNADRLPWDELKDY